MGRARRLHRGIGDDRRSRRVRHRLGSRDDGTLFSQTASETLLEYSVTPLSAWFLLVLGLLAVPVALYSADYFAHAVPRSRTAAVGGAFNAMLGGIEIVFVANGVIAFLCGWEVMTLATAALVATEHESAASRRASSFLSSCPTSEPAVLWPPS